MEALKMYGLVCDLERNKSSKCGAFLWEKKRPLSFQKVDSADPRGGFDDTFPFAQC